MELRVTTFNVENLFNRYAFLDKPFEGSNYETFIQAVGLASIANRQGELVPETTTIIQRNNTALAVEEAAPDILAVQEVEDVYTARIFNEQFLSSYFQHVILLDGNDPRGIDVGLLIRDGLDAEVLGVRSHIDDAVPGKKVERDTLGQQGYLVKNAIFSRDCLEVHLRIQGKPIDLLVNHFKAQDSSPESKKKRALQAERVAELTRNAVAAGEMPIVLGDLNVDPATDHTLDPLLTSDKLNDPFRELVPQAERWTHFYEGGKSVSRLDYTLVDRRLKVKGVEIVRKGLSTKCKQYKGPRFSGIGPVNTEASDHCPVTTIIEV